jgi:hypothetical protein
MKIAKDKITYWMPRILSILFLLLLTMFSLDVLDEGLGHWDTLVGLFMHNIPVFALAVVLAIAWKRELVGVVFFALAGLTYIISLLMRGGGFQLLMITWLIVISGPAFIIAWLFYLGWHKKKTTKS